MKDFILVWIDGFIGGLIRVVFLVLMNGFHGLKLFFHLCKMLSGDFIYM